MWLATTEQLTSPLLLIVHSAGVGVSVRSCSLLQTKHPLNSGVKNGGEIPMGLKQAVKVMLHF